MENIIFVIYRKILNQIPKVKKYLILKWPLVLRLIKLLKKYIFMVEVVMKMNLLCYIKLIIQKLILVLGLKKYEKKIKFI